MTYAYQTLPNERVALARVEGVNASYKDLANVCSNVRGRNAEKALVFLNEAADGERPIRLYKFHKHRGHVGRLGGIKGGWPVKSCKIVRDLLENALANAQVQGMGACKIAHIMANKQLVYGRMSAKGRRTRQDLETAFVEIVLKEIQVPGEKKEMKKEEKKTEVKKAEEKKIEAKKAEIKTSAPAAVPAPAKIEVAKETAKVPQKITV